MANVAWAPQEGPQTLLLSCPAQEIFFGGARGGGKTDAVLGEFAVHAGLYGENAIGLMIRRSRVELYETIERSKAIYTKLGATFNESKSFWRFPNGARLRFSYLEKDSDADQFQGWSITRLYVEEAGTFPNERPILKLMACLRSGAGVPVKFIATGNPGGSGQQWVKRRWIDPHPGGMKIMSREFTNPVDNKKMSWSWTFIPSKVSDNAYLQADYIARISQVGSAELVRAWLDGDWSSVEGAYFDEWDNDRHIVPEDSITIASLDGIFFRSIDWGYAAPFSVGWWCHLRSGVNYRSTRGDRKFLPPGCLLRIKEWYGFNQVTKRGLRLPAEALAQGVFRRDPLPNAEISYTVIDPAAFSEDGGPSIAERMGTEGLYCRPADNKRVGQLGMIGGWDQMRARLRGDKKNNVMIACFDSCLSSIQTIPTLQHDPDKLEDLDTEGEDHAADEWRYACMSRPWSDREFDEEKKVDFGDYKSMKEDLRKQTDDWCTL